MTAPVGPPSPPSGEYAHITLAYTEPQVILIAITSQLTGVQNPETPLPTEFALKSIHPNPFNPTAQISFDLPHACWVSLTIHTTNGRQAAALTKGWLEPGTHEIVFDASKLPSGIYICHLQAGSFSAAGKMVLMK